VIPDTNFEHSLVSFETWRNRGKGGSGLNCHECHRITGGQVKVTIAARTEIA
jgi:hypothetical protein